MGKIKETEKLNKYIKTVSVVPEEVNPILKKKGSSEIKQKVKAPSIIARPFIEIHDIVKSNKALLDFTSLLKLSKDAMEQVEIDIKYKGYIDREKDHANKIKRLEHVLIPKNIDYNKFSSLSTESKEKLNQIKPKDIGQASRISGIKPSDISILLIYLGR